MNLWYCYKRMHSSVCAVKHPIYPSMCFLADLATTYILAMDEHLHGIYKINLNNNIQSSYSALGATPYDAPGAIAWDGSSNTLYWTDQDAGNIKSAFYSGNDDLFVNILHNPEDGML